MCWPLPAALEGERRQRRGWELPLQPLDVGAATGEAQRKLWDRRGVADHHQRVHIAAHLAQPRQEIAGGGCIEILLDLDFDLAGKPERDPLERLTGAYRGGAEHQPRGDLVPSQIHGNQSRSALSPRCQWAIVIDQVGVVPT